MEYQAPYGSADPNAPYVDRNTAAAVKGSIVPAAAIEGPQRELVNLIAAAGITPDGGDLQQIAKAIQSNRLRSAVAAGSANAVTATLNPVPANIGVGFRVTLKLSVALSPGATFSPNGIAAATIKLMSGADIRTGDTAAGQVVDLVWDGAAWQLQTPNTIPAQLLVASGYVKLSEGVIFQWGTITGNANGFGTITLPIAFPNACFGVVLTDGTSGSFATIDAWGVDLITTTSFRWYTRLIDTLAANNGGAFFFAVGF